MTHRTEQEGVHYRMSYEVVALDIGHRCGYVLIPKDHVLYGMKYSDPAPAIDPEWFGKQTIGKRSMIDLLCFMADEKKRPSISNVFDVHGSISYSGDRNADGNWWVGFDCMHHTDLPDPAIQSEEYRRTFERLRKMMPILDIMEGEEWKPETRKIRTTEYVASECKRLINQIQRLYPYPRVLQDGPQDVLQDHNKQGTDGGTALHSGP